MISKIFQHIIVNFFALVIGSVSATGQESLTQEEVNTWFETLSNWGRWGPNDQMGTVNHITTETRIAAANLVETGVSISMAHEILTEEAADNGNPYDHRMTSVGSSPGPWSGDFLGVSYHGYAHSHLDALCHRFHQHLVRYQQIAGLERSKQHRYHNQIPLLNLCSQSL